MMAQALTAPARGANDKAFGSRDGVHMRGAKTSCMVSGPVEQRAHILTDRLRHHLPPHRGPIKRVADGKPHLHRRFSMQD